MEMKELNNPLITVGVLCFNTGKYVINTLDSIINQTYQNIEIIIVDDFSTDDSFEVIENWIKFNNVKCYFIKNKQNKGICSTVNEISSLANGDFISFIGDDIWDKDFLETCMNVYDFPEAQNTSVVYTWNRILFNNEKRIEKGYNPIETCRTRNYPREKKLFKEIYDNVFLMSNPYLLDVMFWFNPVIAVSACIRMNHLKSTGGFNESLSYEDYDMWFKLSKTGSFVFVNSEKATYIQHGNNFSVKRKYDLCVDEILVILNNFNRIQFKDTKTYCKNRINFKFHTLRLFKKEKRTLYHIKILFLLTIKIFKITPMIFVKSSITNSMSAMGLKIFSESNHMNQ
jgi:glycosyltransferase involved in cell wall biosynthesis